MPANELEELLKEIQVEKEKETQADKEKSKKS